jgi:DNA-binding IscR family transcriptional regulator
MTKSPYGTTTRILRADEAILDAAFTAHTVRHQCGPNGECEARRVIGDAREHLRNMLASETLQTSRPDYESVTTAYLDPDT